MGAKGVLAAATLFAIVASSEARAFQCPGHITEAEVFQKMRSYVGWNKNGPLGDGEVELRDRNGSRHTFRMESWRNSYDALTLGVPCGPISPQVAIS